MEIVTTGTTGEAIGWGIDPLGVKFYSEDSQRVFRAVRQGSLERFRSIAMKDAVMQCVSDGYLIPEVEEDDGSPAEFKTLLAQERLPTSLRKSEIPVERRVLMAQKWLRMNLILLQDGCGLRDAHVDNWAFDETFEPRWVDFGSVVELSSGAEGLAEFRAENLRPLKLAFQFPRLMHWFLDKTVSRKDRVALKANAVIPLLEYSTVSEKLFFSEDLLSRVRAKFLRRVMMSSVISTRRRKLEKLLRQVNRLAASSFVTGFWSGYRREQTLNGTPGDQRSQKITEIVRELKPSTMIDIGGNDGWATLATIGSGRASTLLEPDHHSISKFTRTLSSVELPEGSQVRAIVGDFGTSRGSFDLVLVLALTHHLALSQGWPFEEIAKFVSSQTRNVAIIEFMPWGLVTHKATRPQSALPDWYSREGFILALKRNFSVVAEVDYGQLVEPAPRSLFLCYQKQCVPAHGIRV